MSQRLLISLKKNIRKGDEFYDAIYTEESDVKTLLLDWCCYEEKFDAYYGPWKITIRDYDFFDQFMVDFKKLSIFIPKLRSFKDCWTIYDEKKDKLTTNAEKEKEMMEIIQQFIDHI